ncbi:hypothetical protein [Stappia indica]|uniref:Uncharacterized protein n=1 Tax=Stappia indica TaxID=538381 RepID=A0A857CCQ4_9HYPH|nr:hypothetical protein [Stappia indica]QGZ36794.1 hypothetical protein GH266_21250 [Stappia indica]
MSILPDAARLAVVLHALSVVLVSVSMIGAASATSYFMILLAVVVTTFVLSLSFGSLVLCAANFSLIVIWCALVITSLAGHLSEGWLFLSLFVLLPAGLSTLGLFALVRVAAKRGVS